MGSNLAEKYNNIINNIDKPLIATGGYVARYNSRLLLKDYNILDFIIKLIEKSLFV